MPGHRRSIRVPTYDYTTPGVYYITLVIQHRACNLGELLNQEIHLSLFGQAVECWWLNINRRFPQVQLDSYVIMPNHIHGLLRLGFDAHEDQGGPLSQSRTDYANTRTLRSVVQWFKSATTHDYQIGVDSFGWPQYPKRVWQRNYYEHIVRNDAELTRIRTYIDANSFCWGEDPESFHAPLGFG